MPRQRRIDPEYSFAERIAVASRARSVSMQGYRADLPSAFFRSRWEANYARYLAHQASLGLIDKWAHEPTTFWFEGIRRGVVSYKPDFVVIEPGGKTYYVEIKGWMDAKSRTKLKRMAKYFPAIDLRLVDEKAYRAMEREIGPTIPGWEFPAKRARAKKAAEPQKALDAT